MTSRDFLPQPHIPSQQVKVCAVGAIYHTVCESLDKLQVKVMSVPETNAVSRPVAYHPDLRIGLLTGNTALVADADREVALILEDLRFNVIQSAKLRPRYPAEAALDFVRLRNYLICGKSAIEYNREFIQDYLQMWPNDFQITFVSQGYTKCNTAIVNDTAIITSDPLISVVCKSLGFDVLKICPGAICLSGYDTGFIGGCCGLLAPDCMGFAGELQYHPDGAEIQAFLKKHGVSVCTLQAGPLCDVGGIIPLLQEES